MILITILLSVSGMMLVQAEARLSVWVSIPPHANIAKMIGGERVQLESLLRSGDIPETFQMRPSQLQGLSNARIFFSAGLPFDEVLIKKLSSNYPDLLLVDLREGISLLRSDHDHHDLVEGDPHIWLDPKRLIVQARSIRDAYILTDAGSTAIYNANFEKLLVRLSALDREIAVQLKPHGGRSFYVYHPAFAYFADAYGLHEEALERFGHAPSPKQLIRFINSAREQRITTVFSQPQFRTDPVEILSEAIGAKLVVLNPLSADYFNNLRHISISISESLR